jgi:hypothetical protein
MAASITSHMLLLRFKHDGVLEDLNNLIQYAQYATGYTPTDHPDQGYYHEQLGAA